MIKKFTIFFCHKDINYFNQVKKKLKTDLLNHDSKPLFIWHYLGFSGVMDRKKLFIFYIYVILRDFLDFFFWKKKLYKYGINNFVNLFHFNLYKYFDNFFRSIVIWRRIKSKKQLLNLSIDNIYVGDLLYDTYIRFRKEPTPLIKDWFLIYLIFLSLNSIYKINQIFFKYKIHSVISLYSTYIMHGILIRVSIIKKVPVYVALRQELKYLKKLDNKDSTHLIPYYKFYKIYNNCKNKKYIIKQANTTLAQRFKGISDSSYFYMKKNPYLFKKKITNYFDGILFLHDFFDSSHDVKWTFFKDFWEWTEYTLEYIANHNLSIAVKPHINAIKENQTIISYLKKKYPTISWIDPLVSNYSILNNKKIKFGISAYGTILSELAFFNKIPISTVNKYGNYSKFYYSPRNIQDYSFFLKNAQKIKPNKNFKKNAIKFYAIENYIYLPNLEHNKFKI